MTACFCRHAAVSHPGKLRCGKCNCHGYKRQPVANLTSIARNPNLRVARAIRVCSCSHPRTGHVVDIWRDEKPKLWGMCEACACNRYVESAAVITERIRLLDA